MRNQRWTNGVAGWAWGCRGQEALGGTWIMDDFQNREKKREGEIESGDPVQ